MRIIFFQKVKFLFRFGTAGKSHNAGLGFAITRMQILSNTHSHTHTPAHTRTRLHTLAMLAHTRTHLHTLAHTVIRTLPHAHIHLHTAVSPSLCLSLPPTHAHTRIHTQSLAYSLIHAHSIEVLDSHSHHPLFCSLPTPTLIHSRTLPLSFTQTHFFSLSLTISLSHTHMHTLPHTKQRRS